MSTFSLFVVVWRGAGEARALFSMTTSRVATAAAAACECVSGPCQDGIVLARDSSQPLFGRL